MADRVIEIIIETNDKTGGSLEGIKKSLLAMDAAAQRMANKLKSLATAKYAATLRLIDRVSEPGGRINALLKRLAGKAYNVTLRLTDGTLDKLRKIEASLMKIAGKAWTVAVNVKDNIKSKLGGIADGALMGAGLMGVGMAGTAGVGYGIANAVQSYMGFEQQMSRVQAIRQLDKNSDEMQALIQQAKDLGAATAWTRQQVGEAQFYQALAGWSTENILKTTPALLNGASASNIDLGRMSDIVTDTMTAFALKPTDTYINKQGEAVSVPEHYIDMLTKLQAVSNTTVDQAQGALKYSANLFGAMSANLSGQERVQRAMETAEDVMIMTGLMANAGIKESMAGTGMSNIAQRMTSGNRNAYYALGLTDTQIEDAQHNLLPFNQIIKQLNRAFHEGLPVDKLADFAEEMTGQKIHADTRRKLDKLTRDALENGGKLGTADMMQLATMFGGAEHAHKFMALVMGDWDEMQKKLDNVKGTAEDMANTQLDNLAGSVTKLGSAWDAFQQSLFEGQGGAGLRNFVDTLTEIIGRVNKLFSDGIQIGDFANIIGDVVNRLKNKFLELDGVGSLLAGGALALGLTKIARLAQRALGYIRQMRGLEIGQRANPAAGVRGVSGQSVGTMNVQAGVVNINGRIAGNVGGVGGTAGSRTRTNTPPGILPAQTAAEKAALKAQQARVLAAQKDLAKLQNKTDIALAQAWGTPGNAKYAENYRALQSRMDTAQRALAREQAKLSQTEAQVAARVAAEKAQAEARAAGRVRSISAAENYYARRQAFQGRIQSYNEQIAQGKQAVALAREARATRFAGMRSAAGGGAAFAGIFAAMDVFNTRSMNEERLADAKNAVVLAQKAYEEQRSQGATQDVLAEYSRKIAEAQQAQIQVVQENRAAELAAGASAVGSVAGTAIGAAIGSLAGPMGTMIGGMIGGIIGDKLGGLAAQSQAQNTPLETQTLNGSIVDNAVSDKINPPSTFEFKNPLNQRRDNTGLMTQGNFFDTNQPLPTPAQTQDDWGGLRQTLSGTTRHRIRDEFSNSEEQVAARRIQRDAESHAQWQRDFYGAQAQRTRGGEFIQGEYTAPTPIMAENPQRQASFLDRLSSDDGWKKVAEGHRGVFEQSTKLKSGFEGVAEALAPLMAIGSLLSSDNKAAAAELTPEQQAYQAAMENGEVIPPSGTAPPDVGKMPDVGELDGTSLIENLYSQLEGLGEGVQEIFTGLGDSITEGLQSALDGAGEVFSTFGTTISEGLTSAMEGAGEIFSTFGTTISENLTSTLTGIQTAFTSTKEQIQSAWAELPGFFDGVFSGLGGAASAAGAAIAAGLTAPIGSVVSAWQSAAAQISAIISSISAMSANIPAGVGGVGKAEGGFVAAETHFFAGEHGPEVVIPLSSNRRARALDLFEKTAAILGGDSMSFGGDEIVQDMPELSDSLPLPTRDLPDVNVDESISQPSTTSKANVNVGGINVNFEINGADNPTDIVALIRSKMAEVADMVAGRLASTIGDVHQNQALGV